MTTHHPNRHALGSEADRGGGDGVPGEWVADLRGRLEELLDVHREALRRSLDGLSEEEARRPLVSSRTTLLGLLKHAVYLERFYFDHVITGQPLPELGVATTPDRSFMLKASDTIDSLTQAHAQACDDSRAAVAELQLDPVVTGRGSRPVWAIHVQMLRELAQHSGHADILREQILDGRAR